jgi:hypothetical protein
MMFLRIADSDKPYMGLVLRGWHRVHDMVKKAAAAAAGAAASRQGRSRNDREVLISGNTWELVVRFLKDRMSQSIDDIHRAAALLNPQLWDDAAASAEDPEMLEGFKKYAAAVFAAEEDVNRAVMESLNQLFMYTGREGNFGQELAQRAAKESRPWVDVQHSHERFSYVRWWQCWGDTTPRLRKLAMRALGAAISISAAERGHKAQKFVQRKDRNRLAADTIDKAVFAHSALRARVALDKAAVADMEAAVLAAQCQEEEDECVVARETIESWYVEELFLSKLQQASDLQLLDVQPTSMDVAIGVMPFENYIQAAEITAVRSQYSKGKLMKKYKGMFLRISEDGVMEDRCIIDLKQATAPDARGRDKLEWHVVTNLMTVTAQGGGYKFVGAPLPAQYNKRGRAGQLQRSSSKKRRAVDNVRLLRIDEELHKDIARSPHHLYNGRYLRRDKDASSVDEDGWENESADDGDDDGDSVGVMEQEYEEVDDEEASG